MPTTAKPKILCLHGSGTNPEIFELQARYLSTVLSPHFDLVYLGGFLECGPGPGVLPFFEGFDPYLKWLPYKGVAVSPLDGSVTTDEAIHWEGLPRLLAEFDKLGNAVGVLGFSQGAKTGFQLVRYLEHHRPGALKFFVAVCSTAPFQGVGIDPVTGVFSGGANEKGKDARLELVRQSLSDEEEGLGRVKTVTNVHVIGAADPWRKESEALVGFFEANHKRKVIRFGGGHQMPPEVAVNREIVKYVLEAYRAELEFDDMC